jgi:hypothetical protein
MPKNKKIAKTLKFNKIKNFTYLPRTVEMCGITTINVEFFHNLYSTP